MPWFRNSNRQSLDQQNGGGNRNDEPRYYGGLLKSVSELEPEAIPKNKKKLRTKNSRTKKKSLARWHIQTSDNFRSEDDSLADFDESEWTPQDSAYGAACPVCGFIPKQIRRLIEFSMIAGMIVGFVYLLVTTSIHITNDRNNSLQTNSTSTSDYGQIALDDDLYVEYNQDFNDDFDGEIGDQEDDGEYYDDDHRNDDDIFTDSNYDDYFGGTRIRRRILR